MLTAVPEYRTDNIAIAAALLARGHRRTTNRPIGGSRLHFCFADSTELRADIVKISEGALPLDILQYDQNRRMLAQELRTVIAQRQRGEV